MYYRLPFYALMADHKPLRKLGEVPKGAKRMLAKSFKKVGKEHNEHVQQMRMVLVHSVAKRLAI